MTQQFTSPPADVDGAVLLPASYAQELMWLVHRATPESLAYNMPRTRRLRGELDAAALRRAFDAIVARHEILRTTYRAHEDAVLQVIHPPMPAPFEMIDLSALDVDERVAETDRLVRARTARPFDLPVDVPLRVTLIRLSATEHVLIIDSHHIASDGWSRDILLREIDALYSGFARGRDADVPSLPIQYADFAIWQREELQGERLNELLRWWRTELDGAERELHLPTDFPRAASSSFEGVTQAITLEPALRDALRALGQRHDATLYMVLLAAYATVLHRYTGQADVLVGSPIAGRARPETEGLIGYFANTIVQRARFANDPSFSDVLARLRESALGAYDHQDVPFEKLVLELQGRASVGLSPLFQVVFTQLDVSEGRGARLGDVAVEPYALENPTTKFDLTLFMADRPDGLRLTLRGRTDLHRPESLDRFLGHMKRLLSTAAAAPETRVSDLPLLTSAEETALSGWNATDANDGASATILDLVSTQSRRVPDRIAVASGDRSLTYAELETRANRLANELRARGVDAGNAVGIVLERSVDVIVAILGILKAGAAYVPLLPEIPVVRLARQAVESGIRIAVTVRAHADRLPADVSTICLDSDAEALAARPASAPAMAATPESVAYILYTSGSTGTPKGVAVTHANVVHYTRAISRVLADVAPGAAGDGLGALDGWHFAMVSTVGTDLGNTCLFPALAAGGTLHVVPLDATTSPARFAEFMADAAVDVLKLTPSHLRALIPAETVDGTMLPARWLVLGGEPLQLGFAARIRGTAPCRVLNHYGPTETTVGCATFEATNESLASAREMGAQTVPIGRPLTNTSLHVLDAHGRHAPIGVPGELYIAGAGVTSGYVGRADLTAERFVPLAAVGIAYRTGDRVRRLPDGTLEFLGRADDQVKVRGYRVELGDIEHALLAHPEVTEAAVIARADEADPAGAARLVAYVVRSAGASDYAAAHAARVDEAALRDWAATQLPEYMVPSAFVLLDRMPLTPTGKVDRAGLPAPEAAAARVHVAPQTPTQVALASIWRDVLKTDEIGVTDNFIALGGHSLLAIRILGKLTRQFGVRLPLRTLFDAPTIEALGEVVDVELQLAALDRLAAESGETP